jgi:YbgC/YbaW family acyl-CoA thioester hydrolase
MIARYVQKIQPSRHLLDWVSVEYRVQLWDLDANIHMNNVKYLKYLERGRVEHMIHTPWLQAMYRRNIKALIANTEISYVRELRAFERFRVDTRITSWDDRYVYMEQLFVEGARVHTAAVIRMAMVNTRTGKRVNCRDVMSDAFADVAAPALPVSAAALNQLVQAQREETAHVTSSTVHIQPVTQTGE